MVTIKILQEDKSKNFMSFSLEKTTPAFANALRRTIIEEVPTMAIEKIEFTKNNSILYDEMVAHRIGLIPLTTDLTGYTLPEECKCKGEGCARCNLELTMKAKGPGYVKAEELESKDPKVVPVFKETPIVKLMKGQELEFIATAMLGKGKEHTKWVPGNVWYTYKPIIKINKSSKKLEEFKSQYPAALFDAKGKIDEAALEDPKIRDACEGICDEIIKIDYDETGFVFYIESWGQLSPKEIVIKAFEILDSNLDNFNDALKEMK